MKPGANPTNHLAWCTRGDGKRVERTGKRRQARGSGTGDQGVIGGGGRGAARVAVHSVASIMQRHGVFAFP